MARPRIGARLRRTNKTVHNATQGTYLPGCTAPRMNRITPGSILSGPGARR
jgi:hypothetical protein